MDDCLIIGGGVIGLSLAWELARQGQRVRVVDQGQPGRAASWAGAGMLPPGCSTPDALPLEQLAALSQSLYPQWSQELREATGLDNGYVRCGAIYVARDESTAAQLHEQVARWEKGGVTCHALDRAAVADLEPALTLAGSAPRAAFAVPAEAQVRNPRHLKALMAGCRRLGVEIEAGLPVVDFEVQSGRCTAAVTATGRIPAGALCLTAGAWSGPLAKRLGVQVPVKPVRGQIALLDAPMLNLRRIVNEGPRYLVPRRDGLVLVGSTEEEAGFDARPTAGGVQALIDFGLSLAPGLSTAALVRSWAGLRPASVDGLPVMGRLERVENCFVATGHFRHGLRLSPATAQILAQLIGGQTPAIDLSPFRPERFEQLS